MANCTHEDQTTWILYDARSIPIGKVCDDCVAAVKAKYRPEIFTHYNYWHDEPIEEDTWE